MDLRDCSLDEFLAHSGATAAPSSMPPRDTLVTPGSGLTFPRLKVHDGYTIVLLDSCGDVAVVDASGNEAGYYSSNSLIVHEEHRRHGLAVALVLYAYTYRTELPSSRSLTDLGKKALTAAWEVAHGKRSSPWWPLDQGV